VASDSSVKVPAIRGTLKKKAEISRFQRMHISIPSTHVVGQVEWPNSQFNPEKNFFVSQQDPFDTIDALLDDIAKNLRPDHEIGVFVHGFNTTYPEAVYRHAQITHDFKLSGPQITFVWPSKGEPLSYLSDRDSVLVARNALQYFLERLCARFPQQVTLVSHSMGAMLTMEALAQSTLSGTTISKHLGGLVLISPDIGMRVFQSQVRTIKTLPEHTTIFVSQADILLRLSQRLAGQYRLGEGKDIEKLNDLNVTVIDVSDIKDGDAGGHATAFSSPIAISMLMSLAENGDIFTQSATTGLELIPLATLR